MSIILNHSDFWDDYWVDAINYRDWTFLKKLDVASNKITDDSIDHIFRFEWPNLIQLTLSKHYENLEFNLLTYKKIEKMVQKAWPKL